MNTSTALRRIRRTVLVGTLASATSCLPYVRVPLAVPIPSVGGSRPATPQGLQWIGEFGDGVWGQEQERVEIAGTGLGFALRDRVEFDFSTYASTRTVSTSGSSERQHGESSTGGRAKVRFGDFFGGRASLGLHIAHMSSARERGDVQDERLSAWDIALPLELYRSGPLGEAYRVGFYVAPRMVVQTFEDRMTREVTKGTLAAALFGVTGRWRRLALTGEMNFAKTPTMSFGTVTFESGWILLPMGSLRWVFPIGG